MLFALFRVTYVLARRLVILLIGSTLVLIGVAMIVLPGPAVLVIPLGLAVLGMEFAWARHWLGKLRKETNARLHKLLKTGNHPLNKTRRPKGASPCQVKNKLKRGWLATLAKHKHKNLKLMQAARARIKQTSGKISD